jgi:hypothetical protein
MPKAYVPGRSVLLVLPPELMARVDRTTRSLQKEDRRAKRKPRPRTEVLCAAIEAGLGAADGAAEAEARTALNDERARAAALERERDDARAERDEVQRQLEALRAALPAAPAPADAPAARGAVIEAVLTFCQARLAVGEEEFRLADLRAFVMARVPGATPESPSRRLRELRERGRVGYEVVAQQDSRFKMLWVA